MHKMLKIKRNKKGVSIIVGYVLLIVFAVIMGGIVYSGLRTYVPTETLECPDGVSLFVQDSNYCNNQLNLTIRNNGRFNVAGYYIFAANPGQEVETIDISPYINRSFGGRDWKNAIMFASLDENSFNPGNQTTNVFNIPSTKGTIYSVAIVPARFQEQDNRERFARCANVKIIERNFECELPPEECVPEGTAITCGTWVCGARTNNCGQQVTCLPDNCEVDGQVCNDVGQCVVPIPNCGNGILNTGEECDDGDTDAGDGCSGICTIEDDWGCSLNPTPPPASVCYLLCGDGITNGNEVCDGNTQICTINGYSGTQTCNDLCSEWNTCTTTEYCGDGIRNGNEECDDGNTNDNDVCKNDCTLSPSTDCSRNCILQNYAWGYCTSTSTCTAQGGTRPFSGNQYCGAGEGFCCCIP